MKNPFKGAFALFQIMSAMFKSDSLIEDGKINLTEQQQQQLQDALGEKVKLSDVVDAMNKELEDLAKGQNDDVEDQQLVDLKKEAMDLLKAHGLSQEDAEEALEDPKKAKTPEMKEILTGLTEHIKKSDKMIEKLLKEPEGDSPLVTGDRKNLKDMHSKTHFLGSGKAWDKFEDRRWNQAAAGLIKNFDISGLSKVEVQKLNDDADLYVRETNADLNSLERDNFGLPSHWNVRTNIDDKVADGNIVSGEISQARKKGWLAKNKQLIQPEESQIYPAQIDIEFQGYYLQEMLTSWLSQYNKEGSQAYKMSFVRFLISELMKKARQEDRRVAINGVYVKTPENATIPGRAINRAEGILVKLWRAYFIDKKFKIANIGNPTVTNIVDYIPAFIESNLKEEDKNQEGLYLYLSPSWMRKYKSRKRQLFGMDNNFAQDDVMEIENYPNIRFYPLRDFEGSDFMLITDENNIELMENVPGEKSLLHFEMLIRLLYIFGDYKFGVRFKHIGTKVKDGDPAEFKVQTVWCNMPPYLHDTSVSLYDDTTGEITLPYSNISVNSAWATDIENIKGTYPGQIVKITGNTAASGKVTDDGNITLAGNADFNLNSGGTLTLRVNGDTSLTEIKRTNAPQVSTPEDATYVDSIDASEGATFDFEGSANDTLDSITEGFEGQEITVNGGAGGTVTINDVTGNIEVTAQAVLADAADNITFVKIDGVWTEVARTIAP
ncbi:hypothetical protein [Sediminibacter sp. Hel_I_10]|uniref:hypothetical protein n=1 Tax=Sediminibacter sp. Hel_I_10 TaxID=1392490 RepID=UPI0004796D9C|nr:hypothetical protein [Sediminibacter sp. Hel_I_10]